MTDPRRPDDELVSAVLDGEATAAERARVTGDPVLAARLAEFEAVAERIRRPVPPVADGTRDRAIERALAADPAAEADSEVSNLDQARGRRLTRSNRVLAIAAAVVGVMVLAGGLLTLSGDDNSDQAAGVADSAAETTAAGLIPIPRLDLGAIDDPATLRSRLNDAMGLSDRTSEPAEGAFAEEDLASAAPAPDAESGATTTVAEQGAAGDGALTIEDCTIALIEDRPELSGQLAQGTAIYDGADAFVFAYIDADAGGSVGIVTAMTDCAVLAEVPL